MQSCLRQRLGLSNTVLHAEGPWTVAYGSAVWTALAPWKRLESVATAAAAVELELDQLLLGLLLERLQDAVCHVMFCRPVLRSRL